MQKLLTYPRAIPSAVSLVMVQSIQNEPEQDPMKTHSREKKKKKRKLDMCSENYMKRK